MFGLPRINDRPRNVRLDTLVRLRWLAVLGQLGAVLVVHFGLEFEVPIWACLAVIALSALLNVALRIGFRETQWLEPDRAAWLLTFDIAELAALLYLTGGLENPFSFLLLGPVLIAATALPPRELLAAVNRIEADFGRVRAERFGPRTLDVDIISYAGRRSDDPVLTLPHPRAHERAFVLAPWHDIDPQAELPGSGPVTDLLAGLDRSGVHRVPDAVLTPPRSASQLP